MFIFILSFSSVVFNISITKKVKKYREGKSLFSLIFKKFRGLPNYMLQFIINYFLYAPVFLRRFLYFNLPGKYKLPIINLV
jgi:hypothetical protein